MAKSSSDSAAAPFKIEGVTHHVLREAPPELVRARASLPFKEVRADPVLRRDWISFTALEWQATENALYIGLTAYDTDILYRFDPVTARFESLGFPSASGDPQAIKVHRGLTPDGHGGYYFGTAGLVDIDERNAAAGGEIVHFSDGHFTHLGIPIPHDYIQHIAIDAGRARAYGVTYPVLTFFDYDLRQGVLNYSFFTGSHYHESVVCADGYVWGTWSSRTGHCLFRYHPDKGAPIFYRQPIPNLDPNHAFTFPMNGPLDSLIDGNDGYLYMGTTVGELYRLDPCSGTLHLLGRPSDGVRLSGLRLGPGNTLLGSYGAYGETGLFVYDRTVGQFFDLGRVRDAADTCFMIHDIAWDGDSCIYAAETDNLDRSGYLWEVRLG